MTHNKYITDADNSSVINSDTSNDADNTLTLTMTLYNDNDINAMIDTALSLFMINESFSMIF